jgi:PAS domain S-box-containing protein
VKRQRGTEEGPATGGEPQPLTRAALEQLPEAVLLIDEQDRVLYANRRVRDVYGVEPVAILGRDVAEVLATPGLLLGMEDPDAYLDGTLRLLGERNEPCEDVFRHAGGTTFFRRSAPVGENGRLGRVVTTTNVTGLRARNRSFDPIETEPSPGIWPRAEGWYGRPQLRLVRGGRAG